MFIVTKEDFERLKQAGLIKFKTKTTDPNFYICNKEHMARSKTYYVSEEKRILKFLENLKNQK